MMGCLLVGLAYVTVTMMLMSYLTADPRVIVAAPLLPLVGVASAGLVADLVERLGW